MYSLFKDGESVIVNGFGKNDKDFYRNRLAVIICRDPYYCDYNVRFEDNTEDWIDEEYIKKTKGE